jgi:hypothetical protein
MVTTSNSMDVDVVDGVDVGFQRFQRGLSYKGVVVQMGCRPEGRLPMVVDGSSRMLMLLMLLMVVDGC